MSTASRELRWTDPAAWPRVEFGAVVRQMKETVDPATSELDRYVAGEHMATDDPFLTRWGTIGEGYLGPAFHRRFRPGQVLYGSRRTYLRKVAVADFHGVCANTTVVLEPSSDALLPQFLPFVMMSENFHAHSIARSKGSVNPYVNWRDIARFEFPLPPVDTQRRLGELLWAVSVASQRYAEAVDRVHLALAACRRSYFGSYVGDWQTIDQLFEAQLGKKLEPTERYGPEQREYLTNIHVRWDRFDLTDVNTMHIPERERDRYAVCPGDILMCEGRGVGRSAVWEGEEGRYFHHMALHRLSARGDSIDPYYFVEFMHDAVSSGLLAGLTGTSTIPHLSNQKLRTLRVPVPPVAEQRALVGRLRTLRELGEQMQRSREASASLRTSVLAEVFSVH